MQRIILFIFLNLVLISVSGQDKNCVELRSVMKSREKALTENGWEKLDEKCADKKIVANYEVESGYAYTAVSALQTDGKPETKGVLIINDDDDYFAGNTKNVTTEKILLLETNDYQPIKGQTKILFGSGAIEGGMTQANMSIFKKPIDFKRDFYRIVESRKKNFEDLKGIALVKNDSGFMEFASIIGLGVQKVKISETDKLFLYVIELDYLDKDAPDFIHNVVQIMQELPGKGYTVKDFKDLFDNDVTQFSINGEPAITFKTGESAYFEIIKRKK